MSRWFRHYAGMMRDEKLVRVALKSKQPIERVIWVWGAILESAAEINDGGRFDLDIDEVAYFLRADASEIDAVLGGLRDAGRIADYVVTKWGERQYQSDRTGGTTRGSENYVYFIGTVWGASLKIGFSKNPWARVNEFQTGCPDKLNVLGVFRCGANSEIDIHTLLKDYRRQGEWFDLPVKIYAPISQEAEKKKKMTYEELVAMLRSTTTETETETETETDTEKKESSRAPRCEEQKFEEFWKLYPKRKGDNPKAPARKSFFALVKRGVDPDAIIRGIKRAVEKNRDKIGTEFIPQTIKWLRDRRWEDYTDAPDVPSGPVTPSEMAIEFFQKSGRWHRDYGPEPGKPGCRVLPEILAKYGYAA